MVTILLVIVIVLSLVVAGLIYISASIKHQLELMDKEQHVQNKDIYNLMKENHELKGMILQHVEILKYLIEQDPKLNAGKIYFTGPVGEA